jgi:RDD family protein
MSRLDEIDLSSGAAEPFASPSGSAKTDLARAGGFEPEEPLARAEVLPEGSASGRPPFLDLPLRPAAVGAPRPSARLPESAASAVRAPAAPLGARGAALAADVALVLLLVAAALLAATAGRGRTLEISGLLWTGVFAVYLSFFSTVVPLVLFGKTVGMALTGLTARGPRGSAPLTTAQSARRWLGTVLTLFTLGTPLLMTRRDRDAPSPGDRLSGRPLWSESPESRVDSRESNAQDSGL